MTNRSQSGKLNVADIRENFKYYFSYFVLFYILNSDRI